MQPVSSPARSPYETRNLPHRHVDAGAIRGHCVSHHYFDCGVVVKKGSLRASEEWFREDAAKRERFKSAATFTAVPVEKAPPTLEDVGADPETPESEILKQVLAACLYHPRVATAHRMNSGMMKIGARYVRFGFPGCPDILGMLRDGRMLAVEVKKAGKHPTQEQVEFLGLVHRNNGLAFVARSAADARNALNEYGEAA